MKRNIRKAAVAAPFLFGPAALKAQSANDFSAPRNAVVDARGAKLVRVEAGAGILKVEGRAGITEVQVKGTAYASSRSLLNSIKLIGYLSHVQTDLKRQAEQTGCDEVMARSAFSMNLPEILKRYSDA